MAKAQRSPWCRAIWIIFGLAIVVGGLFEVRHISSRVQPSGSNAAALAAMPVTAATARIIDAIGTAQAIDGVSVQPRVTGTIEKIECKRWSRREYRLDNEIVVAVEQTQAPQAQN